jgi:ketosteroid isomerase-like protein
MLTHDEIYALFKNLETGHSDEFFSHVADNVHWTVMGTHPLAGIYHDKKTFIASTFARINRLLKENITLKVKHIYVDGNTVIVEMRSSATAKNGTPFDNVYCWIVEFNDENIITRVRAYVDSALVQQLILENETK